VATRSENGSNRGPQVNNKSGFKGVSWDSERKQWLAQLKSMQKKVYYQRFPGTETGKLAAASAYNEAARKYFKEFAYQNRV